MQTFIDYLFYNNGNINRITDLISNNSKINYNLDRLIGFRLYDGMQSDPWIYFGKRLTLAEIKKRYADNPNFTSFPTNLSIEMHQQQAGCARTAIPPAECIASISFFRFLVEKSLAISHSVPFLSFAKNFFNSGFSLSAPYAKRCINTYPHHTSNSTPGINIEEFVFWLNL